LLLASSGESRIEDKESVEQQPPSLWGQAIRQFALRGLLLCLTLFLIEVGLFFAVSSSAYFPGEHAYYASQANQLSNQTTGSTGPQLLVLIFTNNFRIALIEMVPLVGVVFFAFSIYATARVTQAIAGIDNVPALLLVVLLLLIFPHSYIELPAYAVATAEGLYLTYAIMKSFGVGGRMRKELVQLGINVVLVTAMLAVAAVFETVEIELGVYFWITWVPFIGLVAAVAWLNRRLLKIKREEAARSAAPPYAPIASEQGPAQN
jgi:uncharacterized membrane protein SpoIIM required for sporulation